jgi:type I restriction enzyme S subunit
MATKKGGEPNHGRDLASLLRSAHVEAGGHKSGNAAPPTDHAHDLTSDLFPLGWEVLQLRELVRPDRPICYGILKPGPEQDVGVPYVRVADYSADRLNIASIRKTSSIIDRQFKRSKLLPGDLPLSIRGTVGRAVAVPELLRDANITQDTARLSIQEQMNRDFVLWYLRSHLAQSRMQRAEKGVAVRGINIGDVRAVQIPIPSPEEQAEIVRRVEALFAVTDRRNGAGDDRRYGASLRGPGRHLERG